MNTYIFESPFKVNDSCFIIEKQESIDHDPCPACSDNFKVHSFTPEYKVCNRCGDLGYIIKSGISTYIVSPGKIQDILCMIHNDNVPNILYRTVPINHDELVFQTEEAEKNLKRILINRDLEIISDL